MSALPDLLTNAGWRFRRMQRWQRRSLFRCGACAAAVPLADTDKHAEWHTWVLDTLAPIRATRGPRTPHPAVSPDCRDGKHAACVGEAWDDLADEQADCGCTCGHTGQTS